MHSIWKRMSELFCFVDIIIIIVIIIITITMCLKKVSIPNLHITKCWANPSMLSLYGQKLGIPRRIPDVEGLNGDLHSLTNSLK